MNRKVVINEAVCGNLVLSEDAVEWMKSHGYEGDLKANDAWGGDETIPRHHPLLVECVETLGKRASGTYDYFSKKGHEAELKVVNIVGDYYYIDTNDGAGETIIDISKMIDAAKL